MNIGIYIQDITLIIPLIVLFVASLIPIALKVLNKNQEQSQLITFIVAIAGTLTTGVVIGLRTTNDVEFAFNQALVYGPFAKFISLVLVFSTLLTILLSYKHPAVPKNQYSEHVFLLLSALMGMLILLCSNDLMLVFVGIELLSLPLYVLIGIGGNSLIPKESAFKYFVLGSFASAFLLFGIAFIYGATQTTEIQKIISMEGQIDTAFLQIGVMIFLIGLFFKVALVPFHSWLPDVYQGAPTPITAFMATTVKLVIFSFLLGFSFVMKMAGSEFALHLFQWIAILTMFFGNMIALKQNNLKRMLAYSSISHSGYLFLGIIAAYLGVGASVQQGMLFYLVTYALTTFGAFSIICIYEKNENHELTLDHLKGLCKEHPYLSLCLSILLLNLAGIPPFGGFFAKLFLFSSAIEAEQFWLVVWAMVSSVIGVYYYLKPIVYMYMKDKEIHEEFIGNQNLPALVTLCFSVIMVVVLGFASQPLLNRIIKTML